MAWNDLTDVNSTYFEDEIESDKRMFGDGDDDKQVVLRYWK